MKEWHKYWQIIYKSNESYDDFTFMYAVGWEPWISQFSPFVSNVNYGVSGIAIPQVLLYE